MYANLKSFFKLFDFAVDPNAISPKSLLFAQQKAQVFEVIPKRSENQETT